MHDPLELAVRGLPRPELIADLAASIGTKPTWTAVSARLADRAWLLERLRVTPALSLVALEVLVDLGGRATSAHLTRELAHRTGVDPARLDAPLAGAPPVAIVNTSGGDRVISLIGPCAPALAELLRGLTLPREAPKDATGRPGSVLRDLLAVAGQLAQFTVRLTASRDAHRGDLKTGLKGTGLDPDRANYLAQAAIDMKLAKTDGDSLSVDAAALVAKVEHLAEPPNPLVAALPTEKWVPLDAVVRDVMRRENVRQAHAYWVQLSDRPRILSVLEGLGGVVFREIAGAAWVRRAAAAPGGDGHVTPSFEVMLGPSADLATLTTLALGCELRRFDRVITLGISPKSIQQGMNVGLTRDVFVAALDRVGPRPMPENVRAMVADWFDGARLARVEAVAIVNVGARHEEAAARALGARVIGRAGPGRLLVTGNVRRSSVKTNDDIVRVLSAAKFGVTDARPVTPREKRRVAGGLPSWDDDDDDDELDGGGVSASSRAPADATPIPIGAAHPELVAIVERGREAGFPATPEPIEVASKPAPPKAKKASKTAAKAAIVDPLTRIATALSALEAAARDRDRVRLTWMTPTGNWTRDVHVERVIQRGSTILALTVDDEETARAVPLAQIISVQPLRP